MPRAERLKRTVLYEGRVFRVEQDDVRLPHGRVVPMDLVRHRGSVVLIPIPARDQLILIRQYRYAIDRWIWELPAGSLDDGESPRHAARRECEEEIGLTPRRITRLGEFFPTPGFCDERMVFYRCEQLTPPRRPPARDEDEQIEPRTVTLAEAWKMVARREIIDMKTILGLVLWQQPPAASHPGGRAGKRRTRRRT